MGLFVQVGPSSNLDFLSDFLASCYDRSSLHKFLFFWHANLMWFKLGWWSLGQLCYFLSNFLAHCYDRNSLHKFFFSYVLGRTPLKLGGWSLGQLRFIKLFFGKFSWLEFPVQVLFFFSEVIFWQVLIIGVPCTSYFFFPRSFRSHVAQTQWVGELRFMKLFFGQFLW